MWPILELRNEVSYESGQLLVRQSVPFEELFRSKPCGLLAIADNPFGLDDFPARHDKADQLTGKPLGLGSRLFIRHVRCFKKLAALVEVQVKLKCFSCYCHNPFARNNFETGAINYLSGSRLSSERRKNVYAQRKTTRGCFRCAIETFSLCYNSERRKKSIRKLSLIR